MDIPWDDVKLFLAVAETGSLSAAGQRLKVAQPTVSRRLADLETSMGEPLFVRGVQGAALTAFGERLLAPAKRMAEWAVEVERAADGADTAPRGVVRVTAPPGVAWEVLAPFAAQLREELPSVRLEVVSTVHYLDLARREADLALRTQPVTQRDLVTIASLKFPAVVVASRAYAARVKKRAKPAEIDWIAWAPPLEHLSPNPELARLVPGFQPVFASDDFLVQLKACAAGLGALFNGRVRHRFSPETDLVELDIDLPPVPAGMYLVAAKGALAIPRVKAVADRLADILATANTHPPKRSSLPRRP